MGLGTYHYLALQVISTVGPVVPGLYSSSPAQTFAAAGEVSAPSGGFQASTVSIDLTSIGSDVSGIFSASVTDGAMPGTVSGQFVAIPCASPAEYIVQGVGCYDCPG